MAKVTFIVPIEELHGKLRKGFGCAQRTAANAEGDRSAFTVFYGKRTTALSTKETKVQNLFTIVAGLLKARNLDADKKASDKTAYKAQSTYKTFKQYQFNKVMNDYLDEHPEAAPNYVPTSGGGGAA